jgi:hypothetical protein
VGQIIDILTWKPVERMPDPPEHWPAYCDPENETRGKNYKGWRNAADITKDIRRDIKDAIKTGALPSGLKVSVTCDNYSMGRSIYCTVKAVPEWFRVYNYKWLLWYRDNPHACWDEGPDVRTKTADRLISKLKAIVNSYNRDNSDSQVDYFDRDFYEHVDFGDECEKADKTKQLSALTV